MSTDKSKLTNRRDLLKAMPSAILLSGANPLRAIASHAAATNVSEKPIDTQVQEVVKSLIFTRQQVDELLLGNATDYISRKYDPELGYVFSDCRFRNGIDNTICTYSYDTFGARSMIANADVPCRINAYGNSFTHGDQVSDAETWQEQLAAHFGEPVRNYGVGDYSMYQAYLRMKREEVKHPAKYILFTIYDDDHRRNLGSLIPGWASRPYITVDVETGTCEEHPNPCPTPLSLYQLCDFNWLYEHFRTQTQYALNNYWTYIKSTPEIMGLVKQEGLTPQAANPKQVEAPLIRDALFGSMHIIDLVESFARSNGKVVLYILAYGVARLRQKLGDGYRFDEEFVKFLQKRKVPYVDMMKIHAKDFATFNISLSEYFRRYYVNGSGHYSPTGNCFFTFSIKDRLLDFLVPKPPPYMAAS